MPEPTRPTAKVIRDLPLEAAYLREALRIGAATIDDVAQWSDNVIAEADIAEEPFTELSFAHKLHPLTILGKLESLSPHIEDINVLPVILGVAHRKLTADPQYGRALAKALYRICVNHGYDLPKELHDMYWFDDAYDLAAEGISGTEEDVLKHLLQFTGQFADHANQFAAAFPQGSKTGFPPARE